MEDFDDFYLVLPSNSSMLYYPDNTTTCYVTHLSREIKLTGDWSVGLAEIHIPCTVVHIEEEEGKYTLLEDLPFANVEAYTQELKISHGLYDNIQQLADAINAGINKHHIVLEPSNNLKGYYCMRRKCKCNQWHYLRLSEKIRRIFGFEQTKPLDDPGLDAEARPGFEVEVSSRPASLSRAIPDQMYVYTDVCVPYTIGDTQASLLRIVSLDTSSYKFGSNIVKQFAPVNYIPLLQHCFQSIIIDIRDQHGEHIPFEYGTLTVTLHFKRNR